MYSLPGATVAAEAPPPPVERSLLTVLVRHGKLFAAIAAAVVLLTLIATFLSPKTYTTHVTFIAGGGASNAPEGQTVFPVLNAILDISNAQSSETYAEILRQPRTVQLVIAKLGLNLTPGQLLAHIKANPIPNTSILDVSVAWTSPQESARIANALADGYVDLRRDLISAQAAAAEDTIAGELHSATLRMRRSSDALMRYQSKYGIANLEQQTNTVLASLAAMDVKIGTIQVDLRQADAQRSVVKSELAQTPDMTNGGQQVVTNPIVSQLRAQLAGVQVQLESARALYTDNHPAVQALQAQQREIQRTLASTPATTVASNTSINNPLRASLLQQGATLDAEVAADGAQLTELNHQRSKLEPAIKALPAQAAAIASLTRAAKVDQDVFDALQQKYGEAQIAKSTTLSDVTIVSPADPNAYQKAPNVVVNLGVGLVLALFFGITGVALAERFDRRITSEDEVTERLRLPVLSSIPLLPANANAPEWMRAAKIDSILQLVTSLRYASTDRMQTIAFTSANAKDGKSTIALESAIAMAELEPRVLLVDADLRMPSLHTALHLDRHPGLSDLLVGTATLADVVRHTEHPGLDIITAGTAVPNAFALLRSVAYEEFLKSVAGNYTTIVVDTPACGAIVDAAAVCALADGTVYVVSANETDADEAARGLSRLYTSGARRIVGAVFNRSKPRRSAIGPYGTVTDGVRSFPVLPPARGNA